MDSPTEAASLFILFWIWLPSVMLLLMASCAWRSTLITSSNRLKERVHLQYWLCFYLRFILRVCVCVCVCVCMCMCVCSDQTSGVPCKQRESTCVSHSSSITLLCVLIDVPNAHVFISVSVWHWDKKWSCWTCSPLHEGWCFGAKLLS